MQLAGESRRQTRDGQKEYIATAALITTKTVLCRGLQDGRDQRTRTRFEDGNPDLVLLYTRSRNYTISPYRKGIPLGRIYATNPAPR